MSAVVVDIYSAAVAGGPMKPLSQAILEAGRGLVGDRYYSGAGTFSEKLKDKPDSQLTLIESEEVARFASAAALSIGAGDLRRNIVTRGVRLNDLVGKRFRVGGAVLEGIRLCEPCSYLAGRVVPQVLPGLVHRAGLRAQIIQGAVVRPGDPIDLASP